MTDALIPGGGWPRWLKVLGTIIVMLVGAAAIVFGNRESRLAAMSTLAARVALSEHSLEALTDIERATGPEIYYHVVLGDAPLGWPLQLRCEWLDPSGRTAFYNQYRTRVIYASMWPTHCRQQF